MTLFILSVASVSTNIPHFGATPARAASTGGYATATGSSDTAVTVTTLAELQSAFNNGKHHIIIKGNIYGGPSLTTLTFASTSWNNVTIEGASGGGAVLQNIQLKFSGELLSAGTNIENIVIKNITFYGNITDLQNLSGTAIQPGGTGTNYLGLSFRRTSNVWVDHCTIYNTSDDLMSISKASDNVTVSYSHFYFTSSWMNMNPNPLWNWVGTYQDLASERLAMVIGANASDSYTYGGGKLHVTMHHNWFGPYMKGRPLMRGFVHLYNNYFDNSTTPSGTNSQGSSQQQYNANQIGSGSVIYSEGNYFYKTNQSNQIGLDSSGDAYSFYERNNTYNATTGTSAAGAAYPSTLPFPYSYTPDSAANVPNIVQTNAGPK
ncbi:pectate lyase [Paenibacillus rigui]|uniref:Pectate lyase n=2 Tax=Paenibacillus rigui TaxID=554312 RepID=A0A229UN99_9BACL|nr:pectate lyase [Paenibacillus rigui]